MAEVLRGQVESVFLGKADAILASHMHGYERTQPVFNSTVQGNGTAPIHLVNGAAGNREGNENPKGDAPWSAPGAHTGAFSYALMTFSSAEFTYTVYESSTNAILDSVTLAK